jgi:hypothetical protein
MKKTIFTLNVDGYAPEITELTYPLLRYYANKIGADFYIIDKRKFKEWPVTYEKLQIYELGQAMKNDWNIYIDSDAVIHPETPDWSLYLNKDTVCHNGSDMANIRWRYDKYFWRDGRNIGSCNWFTLGSDWCIDLWKPLDISPKEAVSNIFPTVDELSTVITADHLIDDYTLSRNIAKYGLQFKSIIELKQDLKMEQGNFHWHQYTNTTQEKVGLIKDLLLNGWKIPESIRNYGR